MQNYSLKLFLPLFLVFVLIGIASYFYLEKLPPNGFDVLLGPFLFFKFFLIKSDIKGTIFVITTATLTSILILLPTIFKNNTSIYLALFGIVFWILLGMIASGMPR